MMTLISDTVARFQHAWKGIGEDAHTILHNFPIAFTSSDFRISYKTR